jgi:hypothetical protein
LMSMPMVKTGALFEARLWKKQVRALRAPV